MELYSLKKDTIMLGNKVVAICGAKSAVLVDQMISDLNRQIKEDHEKNTSPTTK